MGNEHRPSNIRKYDPGNIKNKNIDHGKDRRGKRKVQGYVGEKEQRNKHKNL